MEPIDYRQALRRRWRLVVVFGVLGAVVGVLLPLHLPHPVPRTAYQTTALVGVTPGGGPPSLGQIDFFAANEQVIVQAAKSIGVKETAARLQKSVTVGAGKKKAGSPNGTVAVSVSQPTAQRAAKLTNALTKTLSSYIQDHLDSQYQNQLQAAQQTVCNLQQQVNNIDSQIAQIVSPNAGAASGVTNPNCNSNSSGGTGGSSSATSTAYVGSSSGPSIVLTAATTTTSPTTTTTTTPSNAQSNPDLADLQAQRQALTGEYVTATQKAQSLSDAGAPQSGLIVLQPAQAAQAKIIPGGISILDHRSVRGVLGIVLGALVAAGIALLLAGLDKRLRTTARAQETFGYPVIAEIPAVSVVRGRGRGNRGHVEALHPIPVVSAPASAQAEAYRVLRMVLELRSRSKAAAEEADRRIGGGGTPNGNGRSTSPAETHGRRKQGGVATPLWIDEALTVTAPVDLYKGPPAATTVARGRRPVVMIVSPAKEPTRSAVVTNLAATHSEAGLLTEIVTTEDLRSESGAAAPAGLFRPETLDAQEIELASVPTPVPGVRQLGLGQLLAGPGQLASTAPQVVEICRQLADVVLVDTPSALTTHDTEALLPSVEVVVVVGEVGMTTVDDARETGDILRRVEAPVAGVVLTNVTNRDKKREEGRRSARPVRKPRPLRRARQAGNRRLKRQARAEEKSRGSGSERAAKRRFRRSPADRTPKPAKDRPRRHLLPRPRRRQET